MPFLAEEPALDHLSIRMWWVHRWDLQVGWRWEGPEYRPYTTLWHIEKGALRARQGTTEFGLVAGDTGIFPPGSQLFSWNNASTSLCYLSLGCELVADGIDVFAHRLPIIRQRQLSDMLKTLWKDLEHIADRCVASSSDLDWLLLEGAAKVFWAMLCAELDIDLYEIPAQGHPCLAKALCWMRENLHRKITVSDVADTVHLSPGYLRDLFRLHTGTSFSQTLRKMRLTQAKHLLMNPHVSIAEVAERVGYSNVHSFSRAFTANEAITPSEYRGACRKGM